MSANLATIEGAIEEILAGEHDSFGVLEVVGSKELWLQYMLGNVNAHYPFADPPAERLATLGFDDLIEWNPHGHVTIEIWRPTKELAVWIDRYFIEILSCPPDYALTWTREH